jgi:beta-phosphoglucomutase
MDGVLIDAKEWHYLALNKALEIFGIKISKYDHLITFDGLPTKDKLRILSLEEKLPIGLHDFINELKQIFTLEQIFINCRPTFYHQYALSNLKNDGYKIVVCSNSIRNSVDVMLEKADLKKYLDFSLSNEDVKFSKPNPEIYNLAIQKLKLKPEECLIIEDNENGIKAALASKANLLIVKDIKEVNYINIINKINEINKLC